MRKSYETAFKVKVAIEAAKEQEMLQELSARFQVRPGQISQWRARSQKKSTRNYTGAEQYRVLKLSRSAYYYECSDPAH